MDIPRLVTSKYDLHQLEIARTQPLMSDTLDSIIESVCSGMTDLQRLLQG